MNEPALSKAPDPVTEPRERILASAESGCRSISSRRNRFAAPERPTMFD